MSPLPPPERRCRKLATAAGLQVHPVGPAGLMSAPPVRIHRQGDTLAELEGWEAVEDWLLTHIDGYAVPRSAADEVGPERRRQIG